MELERLTETDTSLFGVIESDWMTYSFGFYNDGKTLGYYLDSWPKREKGSAHLTVSWNESSKSDVSHD